MCGICGFMSTRNLTKRTLKAMNDTLLHRGPDDGGALLIHSDDKKQIAGMAHRRLSIIDLSVRGHQPMFSNDRNVVVVFNGEIYNFKKLRSLLNDYTFQSSCDTEVILASYQKWGEECFQFFDGMFAIAIYDIRCDKLILARDRVGKKPLYYYCGEKEFVYASELKAILKYDYFQKKIRPDVLAEYLYHGFIQGERTIFQNVCKLLPGTILIYQNHTMKKKTFWSIEQCFYDQKNSSYNDYGQEKEEVKRFIEHAVKKRMEADVPIGIFFSGGIDSALILAIMRKYSRDQIRTFTIGFKNHKYNEAFYAKEIAEFFHTDHTEKYIDEADLMQLISQVPVYFDEPVSDPAALPTLLLSETARKKVRVILTGDGGDEFFCGYQQYENVEYIRKSDWLRYILPDKEYLYEHMGKVTSRMYAIKNNNNHQCKTQWISVEKVRK